MKTKLKERMEKDSGYLIPAYPQLYRKIISQMIKPYKNEKIDKIISPEMKGILYAPTIAYRLGIPFIPLFKEGRIPKKFVIGKTFVDYSKKKKRIEVGKITIKKGDRILFVDDAFESGKSGRAIIELIERLGGKIVGISIIYNKLSENNEKFFNKYNFHYLIKIKKFK